MTREQFLNGTPFTAGQLTYKGARTFFYDGTGITGQSRSSIDNRVLLQDYECNVTKVGRVGFKGFTYVLSKKVVVSYRFDDLQEVKQEEA